MLLKFSIENVFSYYNSNEINLFAKGAVRSHKDNYAYISDKKIMKIASIYGANASGKSNFLKSLYLFTSMIKKGEFGYSPKFTFFSNNMPIKIEFDFIAKKIYRYKIVLTSEGIEMEELSYKNISAPKNENFILLFKKNSVFSKSNIDTEILGIKKDKIEKTGISYNEFIERITEKLHSRKTLLSLLAFYLGDLYENANQFFDKIYFAQSFEENDLKKRFDEHEKEVLLPIIQLADKFVLDCNLVDDKLVYKYEKGTLDENYQSSGTRYLTLTASLIYDVLKKGGILVIDEISSLLHTQLIKALIYMFNSNEINNKNAQLIFSTHNLAFLDSRIFRSDQIWFSEKNHGVSEIYSLKDVDESTKNNISYLNAYFRGEYGAIPFYDIDDLENIIL